jgi:hypothetical protein
MLRGSRNSWSCDALAERPPTASPGDDIWVDETRRRYYWCASEGWVTEDIPAGGEAVKVGGIYLSVLATNPAETLGYGTWVSFGAGRVMVGYDSGDLDFSSLEGTGGAKTVSAAGTLAAEGGHTHGVTSNVGVADHAAHAHDYTEVIDHTHAVTVNDPGHAHVQGVNSATTGGTSGYTPDTSTNTRVNSGYSTSAASTGITAATSTPAGSVATGTTLGPDSPLSHAVANNPVTSGAGSAHSHDFTGSPTSVVQPYVTVHFWKRTA